MIAFQVRHTIEVNVTRARSARNKLLTSSEADGSNFYKLVDNSVLVTIDTISPCCYWQALAVIDDAITNNRLGDVDYIVPIEIERRIHLEPAYSHTTSFDI